MKKTYISKLAALLIPAITLSVMSCGDPEMPTPVPATAASTSSASIRFINASPDGPALSFSVNNLPASSGIGFLDISDYTAAPVGQASVRAVGTSGDIGGTLGKNPILYRAGATNQNNFTFNNKASYTFIVVDSLNRPKPTTLNGTNPGGLQFMTLSDNLSAPASGKAKVRIVNAVAGESALWVTTAFGVDFSTVNGTPDKDGKTTGIANRAGSSFVSVDAGTYNLEFRTKASSGGSNEGSIRTQDEVTFEAGKIYTLVLTGQRIPANSDKGTPAFMKVPYSLNEYLYN